MRHLGSNLYWAFFLFSLPVFFLGVLVLFALTFPFDRNGRWVHLYSCFWGQCYFYANPFWRARFEGRNLLPWRGPAVLVANHASIADILLLYGLYRPYKWVSKKSVFKLPFIGWNMRLNRYVGLERGNRQSILKMVTECEHWLSRGVPVLLFPEGTRSEDGQVKEFKDGAFRLAINARCPVIPIVVMGTGQLLPKHGYLLGNGYHCLAKVLPPIDPAPFGADHEALRDHVRRLIIDEKARLELAQASRSVN